MSPLLFFILFVIVGSAAVAGVSAAPWLPTRKKEVDQLISALQKNPPQKIIDLGCGDGRIVFAVARMFPDAICHGVEISVLPYLFCLIRKYARPRLYKNTYFIYKSLYSVPLDSYDAVITFLLSSSYPKLLPKWRKELQSEARLYIEAWPLPETEHIDRIKQGDILPLYVYEAASLRK